MSTDVERRAYFVTSLTDRLREERDAIASQWNTPMGTSTRHFVIDDLLSRQDVEKIYSAFPGSGDGFFDRESFRERKRTSANLSQYDPVLTDITYAFQSEEVVGLLEEILGLERLEPDPKLYAGGLSMMFPGDFLNPHIDNSHDGERQRYRRLNLLYYVSPDRLEEYGGNFELWSDDRKTPKTITARQNRLVVMETNRRSWHSVRPVAADRPRCCVSNYYFSEVSPEGDEYFHVTSFTGRPGQPVRKYLGILDNSLRNTVSKALKVGRGKDQINKDT